MDKKARSAYEQVEDRMAEEARAAEALSIAAEDDPRTAPGRITLKQRPVRTPLPPTNAYDIVAARERDLRERRAAGRRGKGGIERDVGDEDGDGGGE